MNEYKLSQEKESGNWIIETGTGHIFDRWSKKFQRLANTPRRYLVVDPSIKNLEKIRQIIQQLEVCEQKREEHKQLVIQYQKLCKRDGHDGTLEAPTLMTNPKLLKEYEGNEERRELMKQIQAVEYAISGCYRFIDGTGQAWENLWH